MNSNKKFIFLVEDDDGLRSDLERALQFCGYTVFTFSNPAQFLSEFKPLVPAVLVTDMRMPKLSGVELQSELIEKGHKIPIIFISGESLDEQIVKAFKNGAFDFLLKPFSREAFLSTVAKAIEQDSIAMQELIRKSRLAEALKTLSPRELQVFHLLAKGYGNKELVEALGISLSTVKEYKSEVMYKLRLRSLAELIALSTNFPGS
ncbi:response regulator transcription factor [Polynucleobacter sp. 73C-SIWE]|uniref:response regulator transcription factor n=1 Tax=Polynucleobacter sp. 73C-SIWE TaxID=2689098 RepID=UPI001C0D541F|nr:response regulator [Polynucleobacter sp. 73C-SIWE]MBU3579514.1 response regulator transcription factor [Polynucleobacter sp. 73C-SIWE]